MKTVAFVPIKLNNQRLPGKNIKTFEDGTPLMHFVLATLASMKPTHIDEIYVYCSDEHIIPYLIDGVIFMKRPSSLDQNETRGAQIYKSFVQTVDADVYVLAHATSPFITKAHYIECIGAVKSGDYDSAFCARELKTFLWEDHKPMNFTLADPPRTQDISPIYAELSSPYVFSKGTFDRFQARTGMNPYICPCSEVECIDIDFPEDFELANAVYKKILKEYGE